MSSNFKQVVSISFDTTFVKIAVSKGGVVSKAFQENVADGDIGSALRKVLTGVKLKGSHVMCVIPADVVTTKNIEVPATDPAEIESIINLQAGRYTPFSKEEILIGYNNIGSYQANHTKVLLVIVKREVVEEKVSMLSSVGIDVDQVSFAPEAMAKFYGKSKVKTDKAPLGIIDVGYDRTTMVIESRSTVVATRMIPVGSGHLRSDPSLQARMAQEIQATLETYKAENVDAVPTQYILTSDIDVVTALEPVITPVLEGATVQVAPFISHVKASKNAHAELKQLGDTSVLDVVASGIVGGKNEIDLLPDEVKMKRQMVAKSREAITAGVLGLLVLIFVGAGIIAKVTFQNTFLNDNLTGRYAEERSRVAALEDQIEQNKIVKGFMKKRFMSLNTLTELYNIIPSDVYLTGLNIDEMGGVSIVGVSKSMSRVFSLVTDLEDSELFRNVKTKSTSTRKQEGKDVAAFEIGLKLEGIAKDTPSEEMEEE